ncbi:MAG: DUF2281 domain-containing protein [Methylobacter sp.]
MSYAELIEKLQTLPEAKQAEVFDFVDLLANRNQIERGQQKTLAESPLASLITNPLVVTDFTPLNRGQYE